MCKLVGTGDITVVHLRQHMRAHRVRVRVTGCKRGIFRLAVVEHGTITFQREMAAKRMRRLGCRHRWGAHSWCVQGMCVNMGNVHMCAANKLFNLLVHLLWVRLMVVLV